MTDLAKLIEPSAEVAAFLEGIVGVVEANSYEKLCLWREYHEELRKSWKQGRMGYVPTIGHLDGMPVCLGMYVDEVDNNKILFIDPTSQVVDHRIIDAWLKAYLPKTAFADNGSGPFPNRVDAMNFSNVFRRALSARSP